MNPTELLPIPPIESATDPVHSPADLRHRPGHAAGPPVGSLLTDLATEHRVPLEPTFRAHDEALVQVEPEPAEVT
jgi:hypothetical protein